MKTVKRLLAAILCVLLLLSTAPLAGFTAIDLPEIKLLEIFTPKAKAYTSGDYTYTVSGGYATITDVKTSIKGAVTVPSTLGGYTVTSIGQAAFYDCAELTYVIIPETVTSIGTSAFSGCRALTGISIPNAVNSIGNSAFCSCHSLKNITLPGSITKISDWTFFGCSSLTGIIIPASVTSIGVWAFYYCTGLTNMTLPDSVISIGYGAFEGCKKLKSITIPASVENVGENLFRQCYSLTKIDVDKNNKHFCNDSYGALFDISKTVLLQYPAGSTYETYVIPDSVKSIGKSAFMGCSSLTSITIPEQVTYIDEWTFSGCSNVTSVVIPKSVTKTGYNSFYGCNSLRDIYYGGDENSWKAIDKYGNQPLLDAEVHFNALVAVFSLEKSLSVEVGDSFAVGFGLFGGDGEIDGDWKKMALVVSNPDIISVSDYWKNEFGYFADITGKKTGSTNITVTDTESGANVIVTVRVYDSYVKTQTYRIDDIKTFYPDNKYEDHLATNMYDINGLYVNNYKCTKKGSKYNVSFTVYNSKYYTGAVDIYDKDGNWLGCKEIEKYSDISSLWDTGEQTFNLISNTVKLLPGGKKSNLLTYEQDSFSKETKLSFEVPEGGYFTISNNISQSPGTFFFNSAELLFDASLSFIKLAVNGVKWDDFAGALLGKIQDDPSLREAFFSMFKNVAQEELKGFADQIAQGHIESGCSGLADTFECVLNAMKGISWKDILKTVTGAGESVFTAISGPAGAALKLCFSFSKGTSKYMQITQLAKSYDKTYATVYSVIDDKVINNGVVIDTKGNVDDEAVLQVFRISDTSEVEIILNSDDPFQQCELYNICFTRDDTEVQPNGKVKVMIPVPEGMKGDTCNVYRQEKNGSWTILNAKREENFLVFETDHFSLYAVIGSTKGLTVKTMPSKTEYKLNDVLDASGLVLDFNGEKITSGFICSPSVLSSEGKQTITVKYGKATAAFTVNVTAGTQKLLTGDIDGNGKITAADARLVLRASVNLEKLTAVQITAGDIDKNKKLTAADARMILRASVGLEKLS